MESRGQGEPYNFTIVFGFTDSTFFKFDIADSDDGNKICDFIKDCKDNMGITVELKNVFLNSIF